MRDYGKVQTEFWEHHGVRRLSTEGKLLYVYLLTGPHTNMSGCFKAPFGYVGDDLGWVTETVSERFAELSREGFVTYDAESRFVLVHNFLKFNKIANRNIAVPLVDFFNDVPSSSPLKTMIAHEIIEFVDKLDDAQRAQVAPHAKPFPEPFPNPGNREQGTGSREEDIGTSSLFGQPTASTDPATTNVLVISTPTPAKPSRKKTIQPTNAEQADFDAFWAIYPRRAAKKPALDAYLKAVRGGADIAAIQAGAEAYAQIRTGEDAQTTKLAAGWINDRRWEDEVSTRAANQNSPGGRRGWSALDMAAEASTWPTEDAA